MEVELEEEGPVPGRPGLLPACLPPSKEEHFQERLASTSDPQNLRPPLKQTAERGQWREEAEPGLGPVTPRVGSTPVNGLYRTGPAADSPCVSWRGPAVAASRAGACSLLPPPERGFLGRAVRSVGSSSSSLGRALQKAPLTFSLSPRPPPPASR